MPNESTIHPQLLEPNGVFQNRMVAAGITVKRLPDGQCRLAVRDGLGEAVILLDPAARHHLSRLLSGGD